MALRINHNVAALMAQKNLNRTSDAMTQNYNRLSSGLRITRAADDAAGLGVSESLRADMVSAKVAMRNVNDGISVVQTAEGALNEVHSILNRMRELSMESANEVLTNAQRGYLQTEYAALQDEIDRLADDTEFNGNTLLDGTYATTGMAIQVGFDSGETIELTIGTMTTAGLGVDTGTTNVSTATDASTALALIDTAIDAVSSARSGLGASENRLYHAYGNLEVTHENLTAAESRIRDVDFADETSQLTKNQVLSQAGISVLAQANFAPQAALSLLG